LRKLDDLKHWSKSKGRDIVVEDAINVVHALVTIRAKTARSARLEKVYEEIKTVEKQPERDAKDFVLTMLDLVDFELEKYWKGLANTPI
jgi:hypothetical protein